MQDSVTLKKHSNVLTFFVCVLSTLAAGFLSGFLSGGYDNKGINMPSFAPPDWAYSVIWTVLYVLIGISLFLIITSVPLSPAEQSMKTAAIVLWGVQFALNLLWPFLFFNVDFTVAFVINALMAAVVTSLVTIGFFFKPLSSVLLLPYWGWLLFTAFQTVMVIVLNA